MSYLGPKRLIQPSALSLFENKGYVLQHKNDGCWCEIKVDNSGKLILVARSRNIHSLNLTKQIRSEAFPFLRNSILIGELEIKTEWSTNRTRERGYPIINLFDIVSLNDRSFEKETWDLRNDMLKKIHSQISSKFFSLTESAFSNFVNVYSEWKKRGIEGGVLKLRSSTLIEKDKEGKISHWIKVLNFPRT
jgi:hypothetical protein